MPRVVVDANVLASAAAGHPDSPSTQLFDAVAAGQVEILLCERILAELKRTLARPYFLSRVGAAERAAVDSVLRAAGELLPDPIEPPRVLRDPDDDYLLALALAWAAEAIVTGDKDLLEYPGLHPPALTPREACARFLPG